ncbi:cytochrome P450 [Nocardioides sp. NPDC127503]|uniref:cytochrome P450 n=1 Tax=Nocardioides sp. NPDC127503 TaxID=3154516 RepID=UPI00331AADC1
MSGMPQSAPIADWIDPAQLKVDPYPAYARLRKESPVAYVPALDRYLVTTFRECFDIEMDQQTFSSAEEPGRSTMIRSMGRPMLRKDDPEHKVDRAAMGTSMRPRTIRGTWARIFNANADKYIGVVRDLGPGADLFREFAVPFAADNLSAVIGFRGVDPSSMMDWSHTLIAGISNVAGDPLVWEQTRRVCAEIDQAIDEATLRLRHNPDDSVLSALLHARNPIPDEDIRSNIRLAISGGMNEPSHIISSAVWSMSANPMERELVLGGQRSWNAVFEETARLHSPVGMYPRLITRDTEIAGVPVPAGSTVGVVVASANRDAAQFADPDRFTLSRESVTHLAFGNGTHICAGNWLARSMVGDIALPKLFADLRGLKVMDPRSTEFRGWVFRGTTALPVTWDPA